MQRLPRQLLPFILAWPVVALVNAVAYSEALRLNLITVHASYRTLVGSYCLWALLAPPIVLLSVHFRPGASSSRSLVLVHASSALLCSVLQWLVWDAPDVPALFLLLRDAGTRLLVYASVVFCTWAVMLVHDIDDATAFEARAMRSWTEARLRGLALPVDSLRGLLGRIAEDLERSPERAERTTVAAAEVLRAQVESSPVGEWSLGSDIALIDSYVDLEASRGRRLTIIVDAAPDLMALPVWPGALAVELSRRIRDDVSGGGTLRISLDRDGDDIRARFSGDGIADSVVAIPPASAPCCPPEWRLSALARAVARRRRTAIALVVAVTFLMAMGVVGFHFLNFRRDALSIADLQWLFLRIGFRVGLLAGVTLLLPVRPPVTSTRLLLGIAGAALAGEWYFHTVAGWPFSGTIGMLFVRAAALAAASFAFTFMSIVAGGVALYMIRLATELSARQELAAVLTERLHTAHARFLRWQMNPHFLFNALNSLAALVRTDLEEGKRFLAALTRFYERATLDESLQMRTVAEESALIREYFSIERIRYGAGTSLHLAVHDAVSRALMPTLLWQPLVENAMKHGRSRGGGIDVRLTFTSSQGQLRIETSNPVEAESRARGDGMGVKLVRERLQRLYASDASLELARERERFTARVVLPLQFGTEEA